MGEEKDRRSDVENLVFDNGRRKESVAGDGEQGGEAWHESWGDGQQLSLQAFAGHSKRFQTLGSWN